MSELDASTGAVVQTIGGIRQSRRRLLRRHPRLGGELESRAVTELDASTGAVVQTIGVGDNPAGVSSDGTHVWVANGFDNTVTELDASTGAVVQTIGVGDAPMACPPTVPTSG